MIARAVLIFLLWTTAALANGTVTYPNTAYVYATNSGILRRIIIPDPGETVSDPFDAAHETFVVQPQGSSISIASINAAITTAIGKPIAISRCAVVTGGNALQIGGTVVNIKQCDPSLDGVAAQHLVPSLNAQIGDTWDGTTLKRMYVSCNPNTKLADAITMQSIDNPIPTIVGDVVFPLGAMNITVGTACIVPKGTVIPSVTQ